MARFYGAGVCSEFSIVVPPHVPGSTLTVQAPDGLVIQILIPAHVRAGMTLVMHKSPETQFNWIIKLALQPPVQRQQSYQPQAPCRQSGHDCYLQQLLMRAGFANCSLPAYPAFCNVKCNVKCRGDAIVLNGVRLCAVQPGPTLADDDEDQLYIYAAPIDRDDLCSFEAALSAGRTLKNVHGLVVIHCRSLTLAFRDGIGHLQAMCATDVKMLVQLCVGPRNYQGNRSVAYSMLLTCADSDIDSILNEFCESGPQQDTMLISERLRIGSKLRPGLPAGFLKEAAFRCLWKLMDVHGPKEYEVFPKHKHVTNCILFAVDAYKLFGGEITKGMIYDAVAKKLACVPPLESESPKTGDLSRQALLAQMDKQLDEWVALYNTGEFWQVLSKQERSVTIGFSCGIQETLPGFEMR